MGLLYMNSGEHVLHEKYITEAFKLLGQECLIYFPTSITSDLHQDRNIEYGDPIKMDILFESHPEPILKNYNWYSEDDQYQPYVAYITNLNHEYERVKIERDCLVEIPQAQVDEVTTKKFLITFLRGSKINPLFWTCKLAPYREKVSKEEVSDFEAPQNSDMGYTYVKRRDESK